MLNLPPKSPASFLLPTNHGGRTASGHDRRDRQGWEHFALLGSLVSTRRAGENGFATGNGQEIV
jgi:hypothetical protein